MKIGKASRASKRNPEIGCVTDSAAKEVSPSPGNPEEGAG